LLTCVGRLVAVVRAGFSVVREVLAFVGRSVPVVGGCVASPGA
jgi:uncharacterized protein (DUF697 family)